MAVTPNTPHDLFFRKIMERWQAVAAEMRAVLTPGMAALVDWTQMTPVSKSFVAPQLRGRYSDVLFRTRIAGRTGFVYVLAEHQSSSDELMAFRIVEYMVAIWNCYLEDNPGAKRLPMIIPLVVHCSPRGLRWSAPLDLADLLDLDESERETAGDLVPHVRYLLDDVNAVNAQQLAERELPPDVLILLLLLRDAPNNPLLVSLLLDWADELRALIEEPGGLQRWEAVVTYIYTVNAGRIGIQDLDPVYDKLGEKAREVAVTIAEQLEARGEARGEVRGRMAERADTLMRLLTAKFVQLPDWVADAVSVADMDRLEMWTLRILTASTLAEVFAA